MSIYGNPVMLGGGGGGGGAIRPKTITINGSYDASAESIGGYNPVTVSVPGTNVSLGTDVPSESTGNVGDVYIRKQYLNPVAGTNQIKIYITKGLRGSSSLAYAGAEEIKIIFDDGNGNEVSMQTLSEFTYSASASPSGGTASYAFDGNLSTYWEAYNTPVTMTISANIPSGYFPLRLEVYQRTGSYNTDIWSSFTVDYISNGISFPLLSKSNIGQSDWAGAGNWTEFEFSSLVPIFVEDAYIKTTTGWEITEKVIVGGNGYLPPSYQGPSYGFIGLDGSFYANNTQNMYVTIYDLPPGKYEFAVGENVSNRMRAQFFAGKTYSDFEPYVLNTHTNAALYASDINITGTTEMTGNGLTQRYVATLPSNGVLFIATSNLSETAPAYLMKIG